MLDSKAMNPAHTYVNKDMKKTDVLIKKWIKLFTTAATTFARRVSKRRLLLARPKPDVVLSWFFSNGMNNRCRSFPPPRPYMSLKKCLRLELNSHPEFFRLKCEYTSTESGDPVKVKHGVVVSVERVDESSLVKLLVRQRGPKCQVVLSGVVHVVGPLLAPAVVGRVVDQRDEGAPERGLANFDGLSNKNQINFWKV